MSVKSLKNFAPQIASCIPLNGSNMLIKSIPLVMSLIVATADTYEEYKADEQFERLELKLQKVKADVETFKEKLAELDGTDKQYISHTVTDILRSYGVEIYPMRREFLANMLIHDIKAFNNDDFDAYESQLIQKVFNRVADVDILMLGLFNKTYGDGSERTNKVLDDLQSRFESECNDLGTRVKIKGVIEDCLSNQLFEQKLVGKDGTHPSSLSAAEDNKALEISSLGNSLLSYVGNLSLIKSDEDK